MITSAPIRFTTNVEAMRAFFALLGFTTHVVSAKGMKWVSPRRDVGILSLHAAEREESGVFFDTDEPLEDVRQRLLDAGFSDVHIVDEAFGPRSLTVTDPQGERVEVSERMKDPFGYQIVD